MFILMSTRHKGRLLILCIRYSEYRGAAGAAEGGGGASQDQGGAARQVPTYFILGG
jgi:hypothetical protein